MRVVIYSNTLASDIVKKIMKKELNENQNNVIDTPQKGLSINRFFSKENKSVYDLFSYDIRKSILKTPEGEVVYETEGVEVPLKWSQVATDILAQKYFRKAGVPKSDGTLGSETSIKQVVHRMVDCWKFWGTKYKYFNTPEDANAFYDEIAFMLLGQMAAPNSPQWFNTGLHHSYGISGKAQGHFYVDPSSEEVKESTSAYERPQPHACFILSVNDDLLSEGGIMDLLSREARIFKYGSGVGTNYSKIRGKGEKLSGGGYSSGLMSFLKIGDRSAGAIKSGGTTRRAARMVSIDLDHPEIESFIQWKVEEEKKVAALIAAGYSSDYEGEAYQTVSGQNSNNSLRVPNAFMDALQTKSMWPLKARSTGEILDKVPSEKLWNEIAFAAWRCADPGLQFETTINQWHTCPEGGKINASNPCSEYMFLDNTACNLASLNLMKFYNAETQEFDIDGFKHASRLWTIVLEISVLMAQFPSKEIAKLSYDYRTIGLGYANLGTLLMVLGLPYDSKKARGFAASITALLTGQAYKTSAELASVLGTFMQYPENKEAVQRVLKNHKKALLKTKSGYEGLDIAPYVEDLFYAPNEIYKAACLTWDETIDLENKYGLRNAQVSCLAPTGTIGLLMDCDTTGIEPDFSLVKFKKLAGGGYFRIVNQSVHLALKQVGLTNAQIEEVTQYVLGTGSLKAAPFINWDTLLALGFIEQDIINIENAISGSFSISNAFNPGILGDECLKRIGIAAEKAPQNGFNILHELGFSTKQLEEIDLHVFGTMTIEGAPYLTHDTIDIFDCANKCGVLGKRFISSDGHIRMMAAVQPFLSGAISKTINLPHEATVKDVQEAYVKSWEYGLKSISLYRDGCKLSQPLSSNASKGSEESDTLKEYSPSMDEVLKAAHTILVNAEDSIFKSQLSALIRKKALPAKRRGFTQKAKVGGQTLFVRTGEYSDGTLGEVFVDIHKEGASFRSLMNCFAIAVSIGLQYGVPLEEFVEKFVFTRFDPSGPVDHTNIKQATSVIDFIFRLLAFEYLDAQDLVHVKKIQEEVVSSLEKLENEAINHTKKGTSQDFLSQMMGDAPLCFTCGHITIRSGSCYRCLNCGNSLGCS